MGPFGKLRAKALVSPEGIEPSTHKLKICRSTTELRARKLQVFYQIIDATSKWEILLLKPIGIQDDRCGLGEVIMVFLDQKERSLCRSWFCHLDREG